MAQTVVPAVTEITGLCVCVSIVTARCHGGHGEGDVYVTLMEAAFRTQEFALLCGFSVRL